MSEDIQYNEAHLQYKQGTSSSFEKGWYYSKTFSDELLLSLEYQLKIFTAYGRLQMPINLKY